MELLFLATGYAIYALLAGLALWGAFCVIMVWRRVAQVRFTNEEEQDEFLDEIKETLAAKNFNAAMELCEDDRRAMSQLTLYAISHREAGYEKLQTQVVERFQQDVLNDIDHRLSWVNTVIKSAPMIGLLGTVTGMMGAFSNLSSGDKVDTIQMAEDIQFALITTACGLAIAVPLVLCVASINIRLSKTEDLIGLGLRRLFESLKTVIPGS
ncbi:MAG: MotA/TolQ/ExbB proton channel family protein [Planctomycetes bacterium]|nr:MotA/TolQ/ExbB proton channel family protein [Planctomycetota bacterium]